MSGVDSVPVIEDQRWKIAAPGDREIGPCRPQRGLRGAHIRILRLSCAGKVVVAHEWWSEVKVVHHGKVFVEILKQEYGQIEPALSHAKLGLAQVALAVLRLDLGLVPV